eukprot:Colp12_sorted_trinity150504_noHs@24991
MGFAELPKKSTTIEEKKQILLIGLDDVGKTTFLYRIKTEDIITTMPTLGTVIQHLVFKNYEFVNVDYGGEDTGRSLWDYFIDLSHGAIFVVSLSDHERFEQAVNTFHRVLRDLDERKLEVPTTSVLVFCNKEDHPNSMPFSVAEEALRKDLPKTSRHVDLLFMPSSFTKKALEDTNIEKGLDWLFDRLENASRGPVATKDQKPEGQSSNGPQNVEEPSSGFWSTLSARVLKPLEEFLQ